MLGLTANIGKLVTLMVSVSVSGVGVLVLVLWTTICCILQKVTVSIVLLITVYRDAGVLDNSGKNNRIRKADKKYYRFRSPIRTFVKLQLKLRKR